jgi:hypothetical protein
VGVKGKKEPPEWFDFKTVALVGNAQSLFDHEFGQEIDAHDLVVRLNKAVFELPKLDAAKSHGTRTDVWGMWSSFDYRHDIPKFKGKTIHLWRFNPASVSHVSEPSLTEINKKRPSCGILMLDLLAKTRATAVDVYGFDWKATKTFTAPSMHIGPHDFVAEKEYCFANFFNLPHFTLKHAHG